MFADLSPGLLILVFVLAGVLIWSTGIQLSAASDKLSRRFGLGEALGGMIILAIVTNLPEIAIVAGAAFDHNFDIAIGNILGGVAVQTVVLAVLDTFGMRRRLPLMCEASSLQLVLEGGLVIIVLSIVLMGAQMPESVIFARTTPAGALILCTWLTGIWLMRRSRKTIELPALPKPVLQLKHKKPHAEESQEMKAFEKPYQPLALTISIFLLASVVTLLAGVALEESSRSLAEHYHVNGVLFGATILAAATSLPELTTGLESIRLGDYEMAVSDILGGNAFLPVLFFLATLCSGSAVLTQTTKVDIYITCLGMILTVVYIFGLIFRSPRKIFHMGVDSFLVVALYLLGIAGLVTIAK